MTNQLIRENIMQRNIRYTISKLKSCNQQIPYIKRKPVQFGYMICYGNKENKRLLIHPEKQIGIFVEGNTYLVSYHIFLAIRTTYIIYI